MRAHADSRSGPALSIHNARARGYLEKVGDSFDENAPPWNLDVAGFTETRARVGL